MNVCDVNGDLVESYTSSAHTLHVSFAVFCVRACVHASTTQKTHKDTHIRMRIPIILPLVHICLCWFRRNDDDAATQAIHIHWICASHLDNKSLVPSKTCQTVCCVLFAEFVVPYNVVFVCSRCCICVRVYYAQHSAQFADTLPYIHIISKRARRLAI